MELTHFSNDGKARMVDVTQKEDTCREAVAKGYIKVGKQVMEAVKKGQSAKGDVLAVATTAGIMAVKKTWDMIPMCHILPVGGCQVTFQLDEERNRVHCTCNVKTVGKTGAEMEALTGVSVALLTIYDMCKAIDKGMEIGGIYLAEKTGGKSGYIVNKR